ncbi:electron transfer flavoprotein alpha subunit [Catenulispora sp. GAS73]|uniref:electron transfer flavoprotein subunit alpha/FixB family protein n=1 Tax=Catenulispora sp. GAS73 TaxID=3156269 RepID=UPI003512F99B
MAKVVALVDRDEREGTVRRSTCVLLTLARRLGEPVAVCATEPDEETIRVLGRYGATEIWYSRDSGLAGGHVLAGAGPIDGLVAEPASMREHGAGAGAGAGASAVSETDLLAAVAQDLDPAAILIAATRRGQETAARLAIRLGSGIITDAVDVRPGSGGRPLAVQRCLADSHLVESSVVRGIPIITVRPEAAVPEPGPSEPALRTIAVEHSAARAPRITVTPKPRPAHPTLDHADIVVAGGRGVGSSAAFAVLADVAEALGAALAGSHTAAELGWIPPEARVGLTGKTIHPRLYLACGVSGSVRHRAGMQGAKTVVAIGDDPAAPIFKLAELGVVGDARAILPALLAEIQSRARIHMSDPA